MKTVRRIFHRDIVSAVAFVAVAFLSLFFFIDFVDELADVGKGGGYTVLHALAYSLLQLPGHLYELMPIAVLIGTIYALARLAQSSEYTILRTGGLGPGRALQLLAQFGLLFTLVTYVVGDWIAPYSERQAAELMARATGKIRSATANAWLKDRRSTPDGEHSYSVNVGSAGADGTLHDVRIFEFDPDGHLIQRIGAARAKIASDDVWQLDDVRVTHWSTGASTSGPIARDEKLASLAWPSALSSNVVAAAVLPLSTMSTLELFRYIGHLADNEQAAQRYEIQFWKRALYPFASLVMMALALPFAYMHARAGGVSLKVFAGIMLGIGFVLLNNVAGHLGLLRDWTPWLTAAAPSALFLLVSLAAFSWLVRYR